MLKKRRPYKTGYSKGFCRFNKPIEPFKNTRNIKLLKKICFILRTNFATRRTLVRLRASKIKSEVLILLSLSVLHLFSLSPFLILQQKQGTDHSVPCLCCYFIYYLFVTTNIILSCTLGPPWSVPIPP